MKWKMSVMTLQIELSRVVETFWVESVLLRNVLISSIKYFNMSEEWLRINFWQIAQYFDDDIK